MIPEISRHLWEALWLEYSSRVSYARTYQKMITEKGGTIVNDHIAFRSLRMTVDAPQGKVNLGIDYLGKLAEALGYEAAGEYTFAQTHLYARHYCHPQQDEFDLPKLFISELIVDELPEEIVELIYKTVASDNLLSCLAIIDTLGDQTKHLVQQLQKSLPALGNLLNILSCRKLIKLLSMVLGCCCTVMQSITLQATLIVRTPQNTQI